jgi:ribosomal protein S18 acetylase RimI-like enzyme
MTALRVADQAQRATIAPVEIRSVTTGDADALCRLLTQLVRESPFLGPEPDEQGHRPDRLAAHIEQNLSGGRGLIVGAWERGRMVGYVEAAVGGFRANRHVVSIQGVGVLERAQGAGIGRAMLEELVRWARAQRKRRLALTVREDNLRAQSLYRGIGFEIEGTLKDQVRSQGVYRAEHLMALILTEN